jgi:hypothetical protein
MSSKSSKPSPKPAEIAKRQENKARFLQEKREQEKRRQGKRRSNMDQKHEERIDTWGEEFVDWGSLDDMYDEIAAKKRGITVQRLHHIQMRSDCWWDSYTLMYKIA